MDTDRRGWRQGLTAFLLGALLAAAAPLASAEPAPPAEIAELRTQLAVGYLKEGNLRAALESANVAVQTAPGYMSGHLIKGYIHQLLGQDADAETSMKKALAIEPASPEANNNYGWFLCENGRAEAALPYFKKALADPLYDSPQTAHANLGVCLSRLGQRGEANDALLAALSQQPNFPLALREMTRLQLMQDNAKLAGFYFGRLTKVAPPASADDLMLGLKVARLTGNRTLEGQMSSQLRSRFPDSKETQQLLTGS
ncbi:type IV pilus biogenesis/stability protein PilW [Crenobacter cavernae]|uniref:type IV pilus biogenesis/stability protein PilW n=1 Tax=Crenobacter cavernae TaxID=2290923 RepID=UPI001F0C155E|nr:type IV pilus biogenesis/stability protein PilW [Crenobacter cavernae]